MFAGCIAIRVYSVGAALELLSGSGVTSRVGVVSHQDTCGRWSLQTAATSMQFAKRLANGEAGEDVVTVDSIFHHHILTSIKNQISLWAPKFPDSEHPDVGRSTNPLFQHTGRDR